MSKDGLKKGTNQYQTTSTLLNRVYYKQSTWKIVIALVSICFRIKNVTTLYNLILFFSESCYFFASRG